MTPFDQRMAVMYGRLAVMYGRLEDETDTNLAASEEPLNRNGSTFKNQVLRRNTCSLPSIPAPRFSMDFALPVR